MLQSHVYWKVIEAVVRHGYSHEHIQSRWQQASSVFSLYPVLCAEASFCFCISHQDTDRETHEVEHSFENSLIGAHDASKYGTTVKAI